MSWRYEVNTSASHRAGGEAVRGVYSGWQMTGRHVAIIREYFFLVELFVIFMRTFCLQVFN